MGETSQKEVAIKLDGVSKTFKLPHEKVSSIKNIFAHAINYIRKRRSYEKQQALKDISFEVKKGEFFGIVGRNGSGKSTLLKLLAGIYKQDKGTIEVNGRLTPFIELGVGFNMELTGRENVFLNGALLGFSRKEMKAMYHSIVEFAELERFMDQKLKNYSSGMQVRLAFSIAIRAQSDILLIDEVLAVGDESFQDKCLKIFYKLKEEGRTIVFISHDMESIRKFCDRAVVIHNGELVYSGTPRQAAVEYVKLNYPETIVDEDEALVKRKVSVIVSKGGKKLSNNALVNYGDKLTLDISWEENSAIKNVGVALYTAGAQYIFGTNTILEKRTITSNKTSYEFNVNLGKGRYYAQVGLFGSSDSDKIYFLDRAFEFIVQEESNWQGLTHLEHTWST